MITKRVHFFSAFFIFLFLFFSSSHLLLALDEKKETKSLACYYYDPQVLGASYWHNPYWVWGRMGGEVVSLHGYQEDYFFFITDQEMSYEKLQEICRSTIPEGMKLLDMEAFDHFWDLRGLRIGEDKNGYLKQKKIVIFGDSLSDTGNLQKYLRLMPMGSEKQGHWMGRFSSGPVWVDYFSKIIKSTAYLNWSYGGMKTSDIKDVSFDDPQNKLREYGRNYLTSNLIKEIKNYSSIRTITKKSAAETLYIFWIGSNNYLDKIDINSSYFKIWKELQDTHYRKSITAKQFIDLTVGDIIQGIDEIYQLGGKTFIVAGVPDIGLTPFAILQNKERTFSFMTTLHNFRLQEEIKKYQNLKKDSLLNIEYIEPRKYIENIFSDLRFFGFKNTNEACYRGGYIFWDIKESDQCPKDQVDEFVFFDFIHPTTRVHCLISWFAHQDLYQKKIISLPPSSYEEHQQQICPF